MFVSFLCKEQAEARTDSHVPALVAAQLCKERAEARKTQHVTSLCAARFMLLWRCVYIEDNMLHAEI